MDNWIPSKTEIIRHSKGIARKQRNLNSKSNTVIKHIQYTFIYYLLPKEIRKNLRFASETNFCLNKPCRIMTRERKFRDVWNTKLKLHIQL